MYSSRTVHRARADESPELIDIDKTWGWPALALRWAHGVSAAKSFLTLMILATLSCSNTTRAPKWTGSTDPGVLLERSLQAMGGEAWSSVQDLKFSGILDAGGLTGEFEVLEDVRSGRSVSSFELGPTRGASGFDGDVPWFRDSSGDVTVPKSAGDLEAARTEAYRVFRGFWFPSRGAAELSYARRDAIDGRASDVILVTPRGGREFEVWLERDTGRIVRIVEPNSITTETTDFSNFREVKGLWLPHRRVAFSDEPNSEEVMIVTEAQVDPELGDNAFAVPESSGSDFEMPDGATQVTLPFELLNNHIYVRAAVNGHEPRRFLVDTGGVNLLTRTAAAELEVKAEGSFPVIGAGQESVQAGIARLDRFDLGGILFPSPEFIVLPLDSLERAEGLTMAGLIGFEVFKRFVVTIDYGTNEMVLTLPSAATAPPDAIAVPFEYDGAHAVVEGTIDGRPGSFTVDTGSRSTVTLHGPFVAEHELMNAYNPPLEALTGWGVGGGVRSSVTRAKMLTLGDVQIPDVIMHLTVQTKGAFADKYEAGNIGSGIFKRFRLTFDYGKQLIYVEPRSTELIEESFDRSGMWVNLVDGAFEVKDVIAGGPAAQAGLEVGDRITAVDGASIADLSLPTLRQRFQTEAPGTTVTLTVAGDRERTVELVLRELLPR
ncbi:MAG: aspartyl protease family protein [Myxococcota bacterium]